MRPFAAIRARISKTSAASGEGGPEALHARAGRAAIPGILGAWLPGRRLRDAEAASAAKSRQMATVVHEFRTPLNGILGMASLLEQTRLTLEQQNYLSGIRQSGQALAQLVEDLLDYSTIEAGRFRLNNHAANLRQLIESVVEMLAPLAHAKHVEIAATVAADLPGLLDFDAARLRQVLFNVIGNAVKFTSQGGVLVRARVEADAEAGNVVIEVSDTGPGMTVATQQRIFREFEQACDAGERSGGTGLGLAISLRILREFGGSLSVASEPGQGSTFAIRFPMRAAEDAPTGADERKRLLHRSCVLLLAPAGPSADATLATVEALGGRCRLAVSAEEARVQLARAENEKLPYTDIIVDQRMAASFAREAGDVSLHRILLVNPEERASLPQDLYDAWLVRPLREKSLVDVLSGSVRHLRTRSAVGADGLPWPLPVPCENPLAILLAEDDPVSAMLTGAVLKRAGHHVSVVGSTTGMLERALHPVERHDLVITDMHMPGDGLAETLAALRTGETVLGLDTVPVIVLTGDVAGAKRQDLTSRGATRILAKPVDPMRLVEEIAGLMGLATGSKQPR